MKKFILLSILFITACSNEVFLVNHGSMPPKSKIDLVEIGDSKQTVQNLLGSPSNVSVFDDNTWIYMSSVSEKVAFLEPKLLVRDILIIKFNHKGHVYDVKRENEESGKDVKIATEETKALGDEEGFFEKAFGTLKPSVY